MKFEKKHWIIIFVVIALILLWYFFIRKNPNSQKTTTSPVTQPSNSSDPRFDAIYQKLLQRGKSINGAKPPYDVLKKRWDSYSDIEKNAFSDFVDGLMTIDPKNDPDFFNKLLQLQNQLVTKYGQAVAIKVSH